MDKIKHKSIKANGINIHVAEIGEGVPVLFLHGFPELWYSWRHQMLYLSSLGYRAIAPDLRGFGDTDVPPSATSYTIFHLAGDLTGLLDAMGLDKVFLVAHDWGAYIACFFCLFRPDRIKALVSLSVFEPRDPSRKPIEAFRQIFGEDYYRWRFQDPEIEEELASVDTSTLMKSFFSYRDPNAPQMPKGFTTLITSPALPSWLTEEDITYYASKFNKTGFTGGLNYYRAMDLDWELTAAWAGSKSQVPAKYLVGGLDITYHVPGVKEYVHNGKFKQSFHHLEEVVVMEGVAHFINQEKSEEISSHIYDFIKKF